MKLKDRMKIKEKRTFLVRMYCDCGGEFKYNAQNATTDIFSLMFASIKDPETKIALVHKCDKCGKLVELENPYPKEEMYEIGIDTPNDVIADFIAEDVYPKVRKDLEVLGYEH